MRFSKFLISMALPVVMAGCATIPGTTNQLEELEKTTPTGSPFTVALSFEYRALASERAQHNTFNSEHFAGKGLAAARGTAVLPESLVGWSFPDRLAIHDLADARIRLMKALGSPAPQHLPALTATAQVKFDCWVEQQAKIKKTDVYAACRKDFLAAMDAIEAQIKPATGASGPRGSTIAPPPAD
jgi:OOP family OmpA-OmpF porin